MRGGFEQKKKVMWLGGLAVLALAVVLYSFASSSSDEPITLPGSSASAAAGASASTAATSPATAVSPEPATAPDTTAASALPPDPTLHLAVLDQLRAIHYGESGTGRDLFHFAAAPAPEPSYRGRSGRGPGIPALPTGPVTPPPPPPPPPIPLKFYGYVSGDGASTRVFLQEGDDAHVVTEGELLDHRYLLEKIEKLSVLVKDTQTGQEQQLPLLQGP